MRKKSQVGALDQAGMDKDFALEGHEADMVDKMTDFALDAVEVHWETE